MTSWGCHRLRGAIVDFADGALDDRSRMEVERHVSTCASCAAAVLELREIPAEVRRRLAHEPGEAFWTQQREAILRAVERAEPAARRESARRPAAVRRDVRWGTRWGGRVGTLAAAAVAIWVVVGSLSPTSHDVAQVAKSPATSVTSTAEVAGDGADYEELDTSDPWSVDEGSLLSLAEELGDTDVDDSGDELI